MVAIERILDGIDGFGANVPAFHTWECAKDSPTAPVAVSEQYRTRYSSGLSMRPPP